MGKPDPVARCPECGKEWRVPRWWSGVRANAFRMLKLGKLLSHPCPKCYEKKAIECGERFGNGSVKRPTTDPDVADAVLTRTQLWDQLTKG